MAARIERRQATLLARVCRCSIFPSIGCNARGSEVRLRHVTPLAFVVQDIRAASVRYFAVRHVMVRNKCIRQRGSTTRGRTSVIALQHSLRCAKPENTPVWRVYSSDQNRGRASRSGSCRAVSITPCRPLPACVPRNPPFGVSRLAPGFGKRARRSYNWHNRTTDPGPRAVSRTDDDSNGCIHAAARRPARRRRPEGGRQWQ